MAISVIVPPVNMPVSLDEAKEQTRADATELEDNKLERLIRTATMMAEEMTGRALITQTIEQTFDYDLVTYGGGARLGGLGASSTSAIYLELARPPLQSIQFIQYLDSNGDSVRVYDAIASPVSITDYRIAYAASLTHPGRIYTAIGGTWPGVQNIEDALTVRFVAGYGDDPADVPAPICHAILMMIDHWFNNTSAVEITTGSALEVPLGVKWLLNPYRVYLH